MQHSKDYKDENMWLMQGDCLERMKEIPDKSVKCVVVDPPYTMTKTGNSCRPTYMPFGEILKHGKPPITLDWFSELYRVMDNQSHFYTFVNINDLHNYLDCAVKVGFKMHNLITMIKDTKMPNRWYLKYSENILFFRKGKAYAINDKSSRDYINVTMPTISNGKVHPTEKPINLIQKLVSNSSHLDDTVIDCFMGSGTTGVACKNLNRKFIGIEMDEGYFDIAKNRIMSQ